MTALSPDVETDLERENARLQAELRTERERQAASAEILRAIAGTSGDAEQALQQIAETSARLFDAPSVSLRLAKNGEWVQVFRVGASAERVRSAVPAAKIPIGGRNLPGTVVHENRQIHIPDLDNLDPEIADWPGLPPARAAGTRVMAGTPLRRDGKAIGVLIIYRDRPLPFTAEELALQQSFADQAVIAIENARLFKETQEALARQTATSEILRVISQSPTDVQPVFDAIVLTATRLFRRDLAFILGCDATTYWPVATAGPEGLLPPPDLRPVAIDPDANFPSRVIVTGKNLHLPDWSAVELPEYERMVHERLGINSALYLPLLREGKCIGLLGIAGKRAGAFGESEIALAESFRDQALIAIENTRLFNETREALERQTATADILKVIASSPNDVQPVFEAIAASAKRLLGGFSATVVRFVGDALHLVAFTPTNATADQALQASFPMPLAGFSAFELVRGGQTVQFTDTELEDVPRVNREMARLRGYRSMVFTPLMSTGTPIGMISVTRKEPGSFSAHYVQLLQTFADQAVIAIENVRLFNETKEALERQTATAEILKVIASSPSDAQPVFEAIATSSNRLIGGFSTAVMRFIGDELHLAAFTPTNPEADEALKASFPRPLAEFPLFMLVRDGETQQFTDTESEDVPPLLRDLARLRGYRSMLFTPLMNSGRPIGMISVTRKEPGTFAAHHVQLVRTFADQAVIAIENVRLFDEVQAKTRDLTEALTYQTGSSNILSVIASSPTDVGPVFRAIVENACKLCGADDAVVHLREGDEIVYAAHHGPIPVGLQKRVISRNFVTGRAVVDKVPIHLHDVLSAEGAEFPEAQEMSRRHGNRTLLSVPLLRENESIGTIMLRRTEVNPFSDKQIALLQNFADQAVIAIGNVRLFDEVQARTRDLSEALQQQTATSEILSIISSSPGDPAPVFDAMLSKAMNLCDANFGVLNMFDGKAFHTAATLGVPTAYAEYRRNSTLDYGRGTAPARLLEGEPFVEIVDLQDSDAYRAGERNRRALVDLGGARSLLTVPLLKDERVIGNVMIFRQEPLRFSDKQIKLLTQFAAQAVIAIENARLLSELRQRTNDLTEALTYQTGSGNILRVIASSPTEVGPVLWAIVETACELCEAYDAVVLLKDGNDLRFSAHHGPIGINLEKWPISRSWTAGRAFLDRKPVHIHDMLSEEGAEFPDSRELSQHTGTAGVHSILAVPLLRENESIGTILLRRTEVHPFSEKQIALLQTFADQAVIAIGNVRLFDEVQARTKELAASLDELRTAQDRLVQTEKLASLGQLTAGIAHEIKNPLNFVNNFSALSAELTDELNDVLKSAALTEKTREEVDELTGLLKDNLEKVVQHGKRADSIVKNMLLHSREGSGEHRPADINALLDESLNLAYHGARAEKPQFNVTLQRDFDEAAGTIEVFPQEITRVFLNLISNGFYAVTRRKMEIGHSGFDPIVSATTRNLGHAVEIRIRDNGTGIPAEVKEKMFNPFFTTKPAGEGTGLGLSMSHDIIVKQHGGRIEVETEPGRFTEFTIVLPRASIHSDKK